MIENEVGGIDTIKPIEVKEKITRLANLSNDLYKKNNELLELISDKAKLKKMSYCAKDVRTKMQEVRVLSDAIEGIIPKDKWPIPTYEDILYGI